MARVKKRGQNEAPTLPNGSVVHCWNGDVCLRREPGRSLKLRTAISDGRWGRMSGARTLYRAVCAAGLGEVWEVAATYMQASGYGLFLLRNGGAFSRDGRICNFRRLELTHGEAELPKRMTCWRVADRLLFKWNPELGHLPGKGTDRLWVALLKADGEFRICFPDGGDNYREDGEAQFRLCGQECECMHVYCFFASDDGRRYSSTGYFCPPSA